MSRFVTFCGKLEYTARLSVSAAGRTPIMVSRVKNSVTDTYVYDRQ